MVTLAAATAIFVLTSMIYVTSVGSTLVVLCAFVIFASPGFTLAPMITRLAPMRYRAEEVAILAVVLGLGMSSTLATLISYLVGFHPLYVTVAAVVATVFVFGLLRLLRIPFLSAYRRPSAPAWDRTVLCLFLVAISLSLVIPYGSFGKLTERGIAFNALHKTDLLHHMSTAIALTKSIPPANPYFGGEILHYYWLSHVFPAFSYAFSGFQVPPRDIMVLTALLYSLLFIGLLFLTLRAYSPDPRVITISMVLALFASGYNALFNVARLFASQLPESALRDSLWTRLLTDEWGQQYTGYSHGWFRSFLVEPHITLTLCMILTMILLSRNHGFFPRPVSLAVVQGALMGWSLAMNSFIGLLFSVSYGVFSSYRLFRSRFTLELARPVFVTTLMVTAMFGFMVLLGMISLHYQSLVFRPYLTMLLLSPLYFVIDYGPLVLLGTLGLILWFRGASQGDDGTLFLLIAVGTSLTFMFFAQSPDAGSQILRNGGSYLRLPLVIFASLFLTRRHEYTSVWPKRFVVAAILLAVPTPLIDIYRISTFDKPEESTYYVSNSDIRAYSWIRQHLPGGATIQDLPSGISGIPAFGERQTALGDWQHAIHYQIGSRRVAERHNDIYRTLFHGTDLTAAAQVVRKYHVNYIYVGRDARAKLDATALEKFDRCPAAFTRIYSSDGTAIYSVNTRSVNSVSHQECQVKQSDPVK